MIFKVFKPRQTLKEFEQYKIKIQLAVEIINELIELGFKIELVLSDSLYGESSQFITTLEKHQLDYVVAIRSNHAVLMPSQQRVRANKWCKFARIYSNQTTEIRYIREIIYGKRRAVTYWEITTDPEKMPENLTSYVMTNLKVNIQKTLGNLYGFRQCKQELGWTDYRFTNFKDIQKWWEIIFSVYTMVSLISQPFLSLAQTSKVDSPNKCVDFSRHQQWDDGQGWKNTLNNLRLILQPILVY